MGRRKKTDISDYNTDNKSENIALIRNIIQKILYRLAIVVEGAGQANEASKDEWLEQQLKLFGNKTSLADVLSKLADLAIRLEEIDTVSVIEKNGAGDAGELSACDAQLIQHFLDRLKRTHDR